MTAWNKRIFCSQCQRRTAHSHAGYETVIDHDYDDYVEDSEVWLCAQCGQRYLFALGWRYRMVFHSTDEITPPEEPGVDGDGRYFEDVP